MAWKEAVSAADITLRVNCGVIGEKGGASGETGWATSRLTCDSKSPKLILNELICSGLSTLSGRGKSIFTGNYIQCNCRCSGEIKN